MGWTNPVVLGLLVGGVALLAAFVVIETRVAEPMFQLALFRIRAFAAGNVAGLVVAIARGGLQFMLIIWLQGIWLPLHGYSYSDTPLWAGIFLLPLTAGFLIAGPISGDAVGPVRRARLRHGRACSCSARSFIGLMLLPVDFPYWAFALLIAANGIGGGMFAAPNSASIMSSVPARQRGAASGMRSTFQNSGTALSIGVFFSLMIAGLAEHAAEHADQRAAAARRAARGRPPRRRPAAGRRRCSPRCSASTRCSTCSRPAGALSGAARRRSQRVLTGRQFFPAPDLRAVPPRPGHRVRGRRRPGGGRRARVADARRAPGARPGPHRPGRPVTGPR